MNNNDEIIRLMKKTKSRSDFQRIQCVYLRLVLKMDTSTTSKVTMLKESTIHTICSNYRRFGKESLIGCGRGGRRNAHLSREEEKAFLEPFLRKQEEGEPVPVTEVKEQYENIIQKEVPKSTIYRLLSRHGWKKNDKKSLAQKETMGASDNIHDYWIDGCAKTISPAINANIAQPWLKSILQSMDNTQS